MNACHADYRKAVAPLCSSPPWVIDGMLCIVEENFSYAGKSMHLLVTCDLAVSVKDKKKTQKR
jgi:hypothetical protein